MLKQNILIITRLKAMIKTQNIKYSLICVLFIVSVIANAQNGHWSYKQCVKHAIENNIELKKLKLLKENKEVIFNASKYNQLPNLTGGLNEDFDFGRSPSKDGTIKDQSATTTYAYLQTSMPVFTGLRIKRDKEAKEMDLYASTEGLYKAEDDLTVRILSYYMQIILNKELQKVAGMQVKICREQVSRIEKMVDLKKVANTQLYDIKAQLAIDEVTLTKSINNVELSLLSLMQLLNIDDIDNSFDIVTPELDDNTFPEDDFYLSPNDIYHYAVYTKPIVKEQEFLLESAHKSLLVAKAGYSPQINLNASYNTYYYHYTGNDNNVAFADQFSQNARKTISLTLYVPIFNRFQTRSNIKSAHIAVLNQQLAVESAKQTLYNEIRQAYANTVTSRETFISISKATISSKKKFEQIEERYQVGKATMLEYNEAKTNYFQSLSEQTQAKFDYIFRSKILDFYNGVQIKL